MTPPRLGSARLSTYPHRREMLRSGLPGLLDIFGTVSICLNEYAEVPEFLRGEERIAVWLPDRDYKAAGRFHFSAAPDEVIYFIDDDIVYPRDYAVAMRAFLARAPERSIVGVHGGNLLPEGGARPLRIRHYLAPATSFRQCNVLGCGTICLYGREKPPFAYLQGAEQMNDMRVSRFAAENGIALFSVPRGDAWLKRLTADRSIWRDFTRHDPPEVVAERAMLRSALAGARRSAPPAMAPVEKARYVAATLPYHARWLNFHARAAVKRVLGLNQKG